ncbi:MAG: hypothetical protein KIT69_06875 [Propionibacteriaceae bacterium]|nr:hypothetical protein [Propionibacteriaceae bacterium]
MDLIKFLEARIAEDEYEAKVCLDQYARGDGGSTRRWTSVLAECEAKRKIIERIAEEGRNPAPPQALMLGDDILRLLALPYQHDPDYDPAWIVA